MPPLHNSKWEKFCLEYISGKSGQEAAINAGYSPRSACVTASRLLTKANIWERLQELKEATANAKIADVIERKQMLTEILRAKPEDMLQLSGDGRDMLIKPEVLKSPAVAYLRTEQVALGKMPVRITRLGLVDKIKAIAELNKMENIYEIPQVTQDNRTINIIVVDSETKDLIAKVRERTGKLIEGVGDVDGKS